MAHAYSIPLPVNLGWHFGVWSTTTPILMPYYCNKVVSSTKFLCFFFINFYDAIDMMGMDNPTYHYLMTKRVCTSVEERQKDCWQSLWDCVWLQSKWKCDKWQSVSEFVSDFVLRIIHFSCWNEWMNRSKKMSEKIV